MLYSGKLYISAYFGSSQMVDMKLAYLLMFSETLFNHLHCFVGTTRKMLF